MKQQILPSGFLLPPVVKNLLIINILAFIAQISLKYTLSIDIVDYFGLYFFASEKFNVVQFITYMFLHSTNNISHLLFNMFALWMFGYAIENALGSKRFLIYYMVTGIGAAFVQVLIMYLSIRNLHSEISVFIQNPSPELFNSFVTSNFPAYKQSLLRFISDWTIAPNDQTYINESLKLVNELLTIKKDIPTIGASGAVFGLLLAFGMMFPNALIYIYFLFPIKAKWFVVLYGAAELYFGIANNSGDNVAHFAHLGGMIFGFFLIKYWNKKRYNYF